MGRKILRTALLLLLGFGFYYYLANSLYSINNASLLLGGFISIYLCSATDKDFWEKTLFLLLFVLAGACLGLGFWLWPLTIAVFLYLRIRGDRCVHELSASYIITQIIVEGGLITLVSLILFMLMHFISFLWELF